MMGKFAMALVLISIFWQCVKPKTPDTPEDKATTVAALRTMEEILNTSVQVSSQEIRDEAKPILIAPRFSPGDCIFGGSGQKGDAHTNDAGYKIISVDVKRNQYLLKCLTNLEDCNKDLMTYWIKDFDKFMLKIDCSRFEKKRRY